MSGGGPQSTADRLLPAMWRDVWRKAEGVAQEVASKLAIQHFREQHTRVMAVFPNIDGGGITITTGQKANVQFPWAYEIEGWTLLADVSGSIVVDLRTSTYTDYPTVASICASAKPTLSGAQKNTSTTLTGWTTRVPANQVMRVFVETVATVRVVTLTLMVRPV